MCPHVDIALELGEQSYVCAIVRCEDFVQITGVAFSPDGSMIASCSLDKTVQVMRPWILEDMAVSCTWWY